MNETCDPWLLACDVQDLNWVLRQPIFEPLSDARIASRQMNLRLVMLLANSGGFLRSDRNYETIRMAMQSVFQELGLAA